MLQPDGGRNKRFAEGFGHTMSDANEAGIPTGGHVAAGFAPVREAFVENFRVDGDWGAAVAVFVGGTAVVDLWGGYQDQARARPWARETLVNAYSTGKGVLAMLALDAVQRGEVALDVPVTRYWPEFAAAGKSSITLRMLLSHKAGLPAIRPLQPPERKYDWAAMCTLLAAEAPFWTPGTAHGYHSNTYGYMIGEVLRRATGLGPGALLRERLAGPLAADYYWGLDSQLQSRVADLLLPNDISLALQISQGKERLAREASSGGEIDHAGMVWRGYFNPPGLSSFGNVNTPQWRAAVIPSTNGHATARGLAQLYNALIMPRQKPWLDKAVLEEAISIQADGDDVVLDRPSRFGLGFQLPQPKRPIGPNPRAFGHFGHGGSLGFADPDAGIAFAYLTNRPGQRFLASRANRLIEALYQAL